MSATGAGSPISSTSTGDLSRPQEDAPASTSSADPEGSERSLKHRYSSHQGIAQPHMEPDPAVRNVLVPAKVIVAARDFACGTLGGFAGKTVEYPLDTLKVRMQGAQGSTMASTFRSTWAEGGLRALYKGFPLPLAGSMIETSCLFTSMGQAKTFIRSRTGRELTLPEWVFVVVGSTPSLLLPSSLALRSAPLSSIVSTHLHPLTPPRLCVAGGFSGLCVSFVLTPVELVKCRMQQAAPGTYTSTLHCIRSSVVAEGALLLLLLLLLSFHRALSLLLLLLLLSHRPLPFLFPRQAPLSSSRATLPL